MSLGGAALCFYCWTCGLLWKYTHDDHLSPVENDENDIPQTAKNSATHIGSATLWPRGPMCVATHTLLTGSHCTTWTSSATAGVQVQSSSCEAYFFLYLTVLGNGISELMMELEVSLLYARAPSPSTFVGYRYFHHRSYNHRRFADRFFFCAFRPFHPSTFPMGDRTKEWLTIVQSSRPAGSTKPVQRIIPRCVSAMRGPALSIAAGERA